MLVPVLVLALASLPAAPQPELPTTPLVGRTADPAPHGLPLRTLAQGTRSGHPVGQLFAPSALLLRDQSAWNAFWQLHAPSDPPAVDFAREQVLAVFSGLVLSTGYSVTVERVTVGARGLNVKSLLRAPGAGCGGFFAENQPFHFVRVPRAASAVSAITLVVDVYTCP